MELANVYSLDHSWMSNSTDVTGDVSYKMPFCSIYLKKDSE